VWAEHGAWDGDGYAYKAYDSAIRSLYGFKTKSVADYARIGQIVNADSYRAMFESAYSRMWDITSGTMIWKLNASSPDVLWEIYDWYLNTNAAYYFTKKACEPLHIQMNANNYQVSVINTYHKPISNLKVIAKLYDFNLNVMWQRELQINIGDDRYQEVFSIPQLTNITPVYFVKLELVDGTGKILSDNLYWESSKTPIDFSYLSGLENAKLNFTYNSKEANGEYCVEVKVKNTTQKLSFMNRFAIVKNNSNDEVLPTFWRDNFITLLPGEEKTIEAKFATKDLNSSGFSVVIDNNR